MARHWNRKTERCASCRHWTRMNQTSAQSQIRMCTVHHRETYEDGGCVKYEKKPHSVRS